MPPQDPPRYRPPTPALGVLQSREAEALWRAREADGHRLDRMESGLITLGKDVGEIKGDVGDIKKAEQARAASAEKRNQRIWQVTSGMLVALGVALVIAIVKIFIPLAATSLQSRPERAVDTMERLQHDLGDGERERQERQQPPAR